MAEKLVTHSDEVAWTGRAADAMRQRVRDRASRLREVANAHDTAAASLEKHLAECDRLTESIADIERRASSLVADARSRIARVQASGSDDDAAADADPGGPGPRRLLRTASRSQGLAARRAPGALNHGDHRPRHPTHRTRLRARRPPPSAAPDPAELRLAAREGRWRAASVRDDRAHDHARSRTASARRAAAPRRRRTSLRSRRCTSRPARSSAGGCWSTGISRPAWPAPSACSRHPTSPSTSTSSSRACR